MAPSTRLTETPGASIRHAIEITDETPLSAFDNKVATIIRRREQVNFDDRQAFSKILPKGPQRDTDEVDRKALEDLAYEANREAELERELDLIPRVDLTEDDPCTQAPDQAPIRNPPIQGSLRSLPSYVHNGLVLLPGTVVEIPIIYGFFTVEFLEIKLIIEDQIEGKVLLRGLPYARTRTLQGQIERKLNEVALVFEVDDDDPREAQEQSLLEVPLDETTLVVRDLRYTNVTFPAHRFENHGRWKDRRQVEEDGPLVCRWSYYVHYQNASLRKAQRPHEWAILHAMYKDASFGFKMTDEACLNLWRGAKIRGGSHIRESISHVPGFEAGQRDTPISVDDEYQRGHVGIQRKQGQKYTFADMFCGAGGTSRGAERAGFKIAISCDHWANACATYKANFPGTEIHEEDIFDFLSKDIDDVRVDVLHLSPPCQVWSPAHTIPGKNDEANVAVLFSSQGIIKKLRPRIFTLEQTFGMLYDRFAPYFNALVQTFTSLGYSVRWKIVLLKTWGLPQNRKRLIMIGSCHGEKLPPFPQATSGGAIGLQPLVTARRALAKIGPGASLHNPNEVTQRQRPPWNADTVLSRTITCSGGENYHWDGQRDLTLREFACLQGFPTWHKFRQPSIKKQIGNAFPPCVVKVLYDHIRRWLDHQDGIIDSKYQKASLIDGAEDLTIVNSSTRLSRGVDATSPFPRLRQRELAEKDLSKATQAQDDDEMSVADSVTVCDDTEMFDREDSARSGTASAISSLSPSAGQQEVLNANIERRYTNKATVPSVMRSASPDLLMMDADDRLDSVTTSFPAFRPVKNSADAVMIEDTPSEPFQASSSSGYICYDLTMVEDSDDDLF